MYLSIIQEALYTCWYCIELIAFLLKGRVDDQNMRFSHHCAIRIGRSIELDTLHQRTELLKFLEVRT